MNFKTFALLLSLVIVSKNGQSSEKGETADSLFRKPKLEYLSNSHHPHLTLFACWQKQSEKTTEPLPELKEVKTLLTNSEDPGKSVYEYAKEIENLGDTRCSYKGKTVSALFARDDLLTIAATIGHKEATYDLAMLYFTGDFYGEDVPLHQTKIWKNETMGELSYNAAPPNLEMALKYFLPLADVDNHAFAQHNIGMVYYEKGERENAIKYFKLAAKQGIEAAKNNLQLIYPKSSI